MPNVPGPILAQLPAHRSRRFHGADCSDGWSLHALAVVGRIGIEAPALRSRFLKGTWLSMR